MELNVRGSLEVTIVSASGLRAADIGGTSDPYAIVYKHDEKDVIEKTPVIKKELNPVWNHKFTINYLSNDSDKAAYVVAIYDKDLVGKDYLGEAKIRITKEQFKHNNSFELTLPLEAGAKHSKEKVTGSVKINLKLLLPAQVIDGAKFTFSGIHEVSVMSLISNQNPAISWKGHGTIVVEQDSMKLIFEEIQRECLQEKGKPWVHAKTETLAKKLGESLKITIPETRGWEAKITFSINNFQWKDEKEFTKFDLDITDTEKYYGGDRSTSDTWHFNITPKA